MLIPQGGLITYITKIRVDDICRYTIYILQ